MQMNGADPYSALNHEPLAQPMSAAAAAAVGGGAAPASSAATRTPTTTRAAAAGATTDFPILDKHTKPLVGSDTAKAVREM